MNPRPHMPALPCRRRRASSRRGVAMLLALFAMVVVGTTTAAYVASRDTSMAVARNAQVAADARTLAASGVQIARSILTDGDSNWRTAHTSGRLLDAYPLDGGTVTVDLVDIERRAAGHQQPYPVAGTTEVEVTVTSNRNGSTWTTVAHMSIPSVVKGEYAIFADNYLEVTGTADVIGRWPGAPASTYRLRVNLGTGALAAGTRGGVPVTGVNLGAGCVFEKNVGGFTRRDPDTAKSTWVYYPAQGVQSVVFGASASKVAVRPMDVEKTVYLIPAPEPPAMPAGGSVYTSDLVIQGATATHGPFRLKGVGNRQTPAPTANLRILNGSTVTLTSGVYEVYGTCELMNSRLIIQGDVQLVVYPAAGEKGLDWHNSSVELADGATLAVFLAGSAEVENCWVGSFFICADDPDPETREGDPHCNAWLDRFHSGPCAASAPETPRYMQPWRVRFYPIVQGTDMSGRTWEFRDTCLVGSVFLPGHTVRCTGRTQVYGRMAARDVLVSDTASFYYDHALDEVAGLTEGMAPDRGGDPDQLFPIRIIRYGFAADAAQ